MSAGLTTDAREDTDLTRTAPGAASSPDALRSINLAERKFYWIRRLAQGGMGEIELIVRSDGAFRRLYAVKRLKEEFRDEPSFRAMFTDEARLAGLIRHQNVVSVLDVGEDQHGPFLLMDYVEGLGLSEVIGGLHEPIPVALAFTIIAQVADGLHAAHEVCDESGKNLGLVHRDVSPQNIMVGYDGTVHVTDFGIAKAYGRSAQTTVGTLKGKLGYVSPEQLRFMPLDRRSDLFSLGVVLYELLTLTRLYSNRDGRGPERILLEAPPDVGLERDDIPPQVVELLFQMLSKEVSERPATAHEVAETLRTALAELQILGRESVSVAMFMRAAFSECEDTQKTEISEAFRNLARGNLPSWPRISEVESPRSLPRRNSGPIAALGGLAVILLLAAGVGIGAWLGNRRQVAPPPHASNEATPILTSRPPDANLEANTPVRTAGVLEAPSASDERAADDEPPTIVPRRRQPRRFAEPSPDDTTATREDVEAEPESETSTGTTPSGRLSPWTFSGSAP